MKFPTRAGVLLFAFGAAAASAHTVASAAELTPAPVSTTEDAIPQEQVPFAVPLGGALQRTAAPLPAPSISGSLPATPVAPPAEPRAARPGYGSVLPDKVVRPLRVTHAGPSLDAQAPLPNIGRTVRPGTLELAAPSAPLRTAGPALGLGHPLAFEPKTPGGLRDGRMRLGDIDPSLVTAPVSAVPGGKLSLGNDNRPVSVPHTVSDGVTTTGAMAHELPGAL